jgi:hypothetical protein
MRLVRNINDDEDDDNINDDNDNNINDDNDNNIKGDRSFERRTKNNQPEQQRCNIILEKDHNNKIEGQGKNKEVHEQEQKKTITTT